MVARACNASICGLATGSGVSEMRIGTPSDALLDPFAVRTLRRLNLDLLFLGVDGRGPKGVLQQTG
jgi:hypothetical protein